MFSDVIFLGCLCVVFGFFNIGLIVMHFSKPMIFEFRSPFVVKKKTHDEHR